MSLLIEKPQEKDIKDMLQLDKHIQKDMMLEKLKRGELLVAREDGKIVGYVRYGLLWDELPFLSLIFVSTNVQKQRVGSQLMDAWEKEMQKNGHKKVLTSSLANETAQHFYRKRGYRDVGSFVMPGEAAEIFFLKEF